MVHVRCAVSLLFAIGSVFASIETHAQMEDPTTQQGLKPYASYHGADIDVVSLVNAKIDLHIPLLSFPQRGNLKLGFTIRYDNPRLDEQRDQPGTCGTIGNPCTYWSEFSGAGVEVVPDLSYGIYQQAVYDTAHNFKGYLYSVQDSSGATHALGNSSGTIYESADATGYKWNSSTNVITDRDGTRYYNTQPYIIVPGYIPPPVSKVEDTNGNQITYNSGVFTDSVGRTISLNTTSTTDYTHCTGQLPINSATLWTVPGPNGGNVTYKFCYVTFALNVMLETGRYHYADTHNVTMLQSIVLPNNTSWTFDYNTPSGELTKITEPTGGTITYAYLNRHTCGPYNVNLWPHYYEYATHTRSVDARNGSGPSTWTYSMGPSYGVIGTVTDPLGNDTVHTITDLGWCTLYETQTQYYQGPASSNVLLKTVNTDYSSVQGTLLGSGSRIMYNVVPIRATTTLPLASGGTQITKVEKDYDSGFTFTDVYGTQYSGTYGKVVTEREYDYGSGGAGTLLRRTATSYQAFSSSSYRTYNLLDAVGSVAIYDSTANTCRGISTYCAYSYYGYDESALQSSGITTQHNSSPINGTTRGNQTSVHQWLNTNSSYLNTTRTFFDTGMRYQVTDPGGHTTTYAYSSTYAGAYPTTVTNALSQQTTHVYDFNTGLRTSTTDSNQLTMTYSYDSLSRLQQTTRPDSSVDTDTISRQESTAPFTATLTSAINTSQSTAPLSVFDGLGRVSQTQHTSDPQGVDYTDTTYDPLGRVASVSNPYRTGTDATSSPGTTTYTYDALGRKTLETFPGGSAVTTAYCGQWTLVTDPTGKWRRSRTDGLGRLIEVDEPNSTTASVNSNGCPGTGEPIWVSSYSVDALGSLMQVVQNGSHQRAFTYDSVSRLLTANNPETGTITYAYNSDNTVLTKKDARGITTCFGDWSMGTSTCSGSTGYDALHRILKITYSNGDSSLTFAYDSSNCLGLAACQNIGHRTSMTDSAGSESWAFQVDETNNRNIHRNQRTTTSSPSNVTKTTTYYFDFQGNVTQIVYPTGRTINYTYDSANRPSSAADSSNGITYVADFRTPPSNTTCTAGAVCYTPQGSIYAMSLGQSSSFTGFNSLLTFNNRLQPSEIKGSSSVGTAFDITYSFVDPVSTKNSGHVYGITNNLNSNRSQTFTYDQLNRITSAGTTATTGSYCWGYQYSYDAWGNLLSQAGWSPTYNSCTETSMGTVTADGGNHISGFSYDASGNTQSDGVYSYTWDAESQLKTAGGVTYSYDGNGRRMAKVGSKLYWYGSGGEILSETDASGNTLNEYIYFGGKRVAVVPNSGNPLYYAEDMLGSSRVIVQSNGTLCYDADFTPFGGERSYTNTCPQNYKFEGKERDTETQNDGFGAREYSWRFGRWLSADWSSVPAPVPYANLTNPQTLNLYAMVVDDPESFADLDGHETNQGQEAQTACEGNQQCAQNNPQGNDKKPNPQKKAQNACQSQNCNVKVIGDTGKDNGGAGTPNPFVAGVNQREVTYQAVDSKGNAVSGAEISLHETPLPGNEGGDAKNYSYASGKGTSNSEKGDEGAHRAGQFTDLMTTGGKGAAGFRQTYTVEGKSANIIWPTKSGGVVAPSQKVLDRRDKVMIIPEVRQ